MAGARSFCESLIMTEITTKRHILDAYLALLCSRPLAAISMHDVATEADVSLAVLRGTYGSEEALFDAFAELVDAQVLDRTTDLVIDRPAKDRLFDVLMTRIGVLTPYQPAIRALKQAARDNPALAMLFGQISAREQSWMLVAARIDIRGAAAINLAQALVLVFARTVETWLEDPTQDKTLTKTVLQRELEVGAKWMNDLSLAK